MHHALSSIQYVYAYACACTCTRKCNHTYIHVKSGSHVSKVLITLVSLTCHMRVIITLPMNCIESDHSLLPGMAAALTVVSYLLFIVPYSRVVTPPSLLRPPPPLQREVNTAKGHFLLRYTPPHLHMHTCVWLALTSMFTLVLRCYYVVIFAKCVRLFPCGRLRTCGTGL